MLTDLVVEELGRGILSEADREYLSVGREEYGSNRSRQAVQKREQEIKNRLRAGIIDFKLLSNPELLSDDLLTETIESLNIESNYSTTTIQWRGYNGSKEIEWPWMAEALLSQIVSFVYRCNPNDFEKIVKSGLLNAIEHYDSHTSIKEVNIEVENVDLTISRAKEKMERNEQLSDTEVRILLEKSEVGSDKLARYIRSRPDPIETEEKVKTAVEMAISDASIDDMLELVRPDFDEADYSQKEKTELFEEYEDDIREFLKSTKKETYETLEGNDSA